MNVFLRFFDSAWQKWPWHIWTHLCNIWSAIRILIFLRNTKVSKIGVTYFAMIVALNKVHRVHCWTQVNSANMRPVWCHRPQKCVVYENISWVLNLAILKLVKIKQGWCLLFNEVISILTFFTFIVAFNLIDTENLWFWNLCQAQYGGLHLRKQNISLWMGTLQETLEKWIFWVCAQNLDGTEGQSKIDFIVEINTPKYHKTCH